MKVKEKEKEVERRGDRVGEQSSRVLQDLFFFITLHPPSFAQETL